MSELHIFQRYATAENVVTNNTMMLLRRIYSHSQARFEELVLALWDQGYELPRLGLRFTQQERGIKSVPDGVMFQASVKFVVETKMGDVFDTDQVRRHFEELSRADHRFALLLGAGVIDLKSPEMVALQHEARELGIALAVVTFASLIELARKLFERHHEEMIDLVADYEAFCDAAGLLPQDLWTVFVPPCGSSFLHNIKEKLYYCPADRAIRRTRYLGVYAEKTVQAIGTISRVLDRPAIDLQKRTVIPIDGGALSADEQERIVRACEAAAQLDWPIEEEHKFYLCDEMAVTDFRKRTAGGIQNRRYLNLREAFEKIAVPSDLFQLAESLKSRTWQ